MPLEKLIAHLPEWEEPEDFDTFLNSPLMEAQSFLPDPIFEPTD
jgi:cephalosporin-C deacetylase-like acetyl esterase